MYRILARTIALVALAVLPGSLLRADFLYFTTDSGIERITTTGTDRQVIVSDLSGSGPTGIAIDSVNRVYWTEAITSDIHRSDAAGGNIETLLDRQFSFVHGDIAISEVNDRMVWREANGLGIDDLSAATAANPTSLIGANPSAVAIVGQTVYFANNAFGSSTIRTMSITGGASTDFLPINNSLIRDIAIHDGFLYATDSQNNSIVRASLSGAPNLTTLVSGVNADFAKGLVIDASSSRMFWINADTLGGNIFSANLDGSNVTSITTLTGNANYLAISAVPEPSSLALAGIACGAILVRFRKRSLAAGR